MTFLYALILLTACFWAGWAIGHFPGVRAKILAVLGVVLAALATWWEAVMAWVGG